MPHRLRSLLLVKAEVAGGERCERSLYILWRRSNWRDDVSMHSTGGIRANSVLNFSFRTNNGNLIDEIIR